MTCAEFLKERKYLKGVSPKTIEYYEDCFEAWKKYGNTNGIPDPKNFVVNMRAAGARASSVNCFARGLNAYFKWAGLPYKIPRLKEEERVIETLSLDAAGRILSYKPKRSGIHRAKTLCLLLLDTGLRIDEALSIRVNNINFDQQIICVKGKGNRERYVPFSNEIRKQLWKFKGSAVNETLLFRTRDGLKLGHRNITRDVAFLFSDIGLKPPRRLLHSFRHSFSTNFLRLGGNVFMLQRILGHRSISVTQKYIQFVSSDMVEQHRSVLA